MPKETVTLPPGNYIIGDPDYFREYAPYTFFWTYSDGAFYDNLDNCYYVDSARLAVFQIEKKPNKMPKGTHYFFFKSPWKIDFDMDHLSEHIKITVLSFKDISPNFFDPILFDN